MKIKNFSCTQVNQDNLDKIAAEVNEFTTTHNTIDIKVNAVANNFGCVIIYTVLYQEE